MQNVNDILAKAQLAREDLKTLLLLEGEDKKMLFRHAAKVKKEAVDDKVYYRGLIEFSNVCDKNCYYCGIRKDNDKVERYNVTDEQIVESAIYAWENRYASIVLQSGELMNEVYINRVERLLKTIHKKTNNELHVTLSCGEQTKATYERWYNAGAHRYLLRIEASNKDLYEKLHPNDELHSYDARLKALHTLREVGYQTGTGIMVGSPYQTIDDLVDDLMFMRDIDVDMVGLGPFIEHEDTPFNRFKDELPSLEERLQLTFKYIAILRIMMPDINIAAATALQAIDKVGREKAIQIGANVIMPNLTPGTYRDSYKLYDNKPCTDENIEDCGSCMEARITLANHKVALGEWGDSKHYKSRNL